MNNVYVLPRQRWSDLIARVGSLVAGLANRVRESVRAVAARIGLRRDFGPPTEIIDDGDDAIIRLDIPSVDAERDVTVEVDGGTLVIAGVRREPISDDEQAPGGHEF